MDELLRAGDIEALASFCEQEELMAIGGVPSALVYSTLLGVYLLQNELDHAKLLWQRIPTTVKESNHEIGELWEIGKRLWRRDFASVYELAKNPSWPPHLQPLVSGLVVKLRERVLVLVGKAYTAIRSHNLCAFLGQPESEVRQIAADCGWEFDEKNDVFKPTPKQALEGEVLEDHKERLQRLTDIISFLEN